MHRESMEIMVVGQMEPFRRKDLSGKMGLLKRMGLHILTLDAPTYLTVVLVYVYVRVDVQQGIPLHILPTTVKTGVVCRPSEPG